MKNWLSIKLGLALFVIIVFGTLAFECPAQVTMPEIIVTAPRIGGGNLMCSGMSCTFVVAEMRMAANMENLMEQLPLQEDPPLVCCLINSDSKNISIR